MSETTQNQATTDDETVLIEAQKKLEKAREEYARQKNLGLLSGILQPAESFQRETCIRCQAPLPPRRKMQCEECDGKVARIIEEREERDRLERIETYLLRSGLPADYRKARRTWIDVRKQLGPADASVVEILRQGRGLYLWGGAGPFKTSLAASYLAKTISDEARSGQYVFVPDLFTELYEIYNAPPEDRRSRADVIERYGMTDCLVMDDLGKERPTEHAASVLMQIFDMRYREGRRWMIVTSNYPLDALAARLDAGAGTEYAEPILRRITEMCVSVPMDRARG